MQGRILTISEVGQIAGTKKLADSDKKKKTTKGF